MKTCSGFLIKCIHIYTNIVCPHPRLPSAIIHKHITSNVTGCHGGPKRKLRAGVACTAHFCKFIQFLVTWGYQLQLSIPSAYFVYTVWHSTGKHCSSMYACTYHLFVGMWRPLV